MLSDNTVYCIILFLSISFGYLVQRIKSPTNKQRACSAFGAAIIVCTCHFHAIHSIITVAGTCLIQILLGKRYCHTASFIWCFGYLMLFRTIHLFGIPKPPPLANAVQLILTLKLVGLSFEIHDSAGDVKQKGDNCVEGEEALRRKYVNISPSLMDIIHYSYCYIGLFTGPYFRYRSYIDMITEKNSEIIPTTKPLLDRFKIVPVSGVVFLILSYYFSIEYVPTEDFHNQPFWYRLFYMVPMFMIFRARLFVAFVSGECICIAARLGAYPVKALPKYGQGPTDLKVLDKLKTEDAKTVEYNYETIRNLDLYRTELAPKLRDGLRSWNMSVQYWLATYIYRRCPIKAYRTSATMIVSAFWHGIHPGYYLSFLTVPLILMAEDIMIAAFRKDSSPQFQNIFDWINWFLRMRFFDYMCMGFLLLSWEHTIGYWMSVYFWAHFLTLSLIIIGTVFKGKSKTKLEVDNKNMENTGNISPKKES